MVARKNPMLGRWRIVEMELWDDDFVNLIQPAYISFDNQGSGEFAFGAVQAGLDCRYGADGVHFTWNGFDEMDPILGDGNAAIQIDGSLEGNIRIRLGDESRFKARRDCSQSPAQLP